MTHPVAERLLYGVVDGKDVVVTVRLWPPERAVGIDPVCRFTFHSENPSTLTDGQGHGVDEVQALIEALHGVGSVLDKSGIDWSMFSEADYASDHSDPAIWDIRDDGFPRADVSVMFYGKAFRERMGAYVEGEKIAMLQSVAQRKGGLD